MNYRVLRDCIIKGARAKSGDVIVLDDKTANEMMAHRHSSQSQLAWIGFLLSGQR